MDCIQIKPIMRGEMAMSNSKFKIGQEILMKEDVVVSGFSETRLVKKGDKAYIDGHGYLHYTTGESKGRMARSNLKVEGYDYENIARMIYNKLNYYGLDRFIEDNQVNKREFIEEIEVALIEIL